MINAVLQAINANMPPIQKQYCLLERSETGKTVEYSSGGNFSTIPFDTYAMGSYWRLRGDITISESEGVIATQKKVTMEFPLFFVVWYRRDEVDSQDELAELITHAIVSTGNGNNKIRTNVSRLTYDAAQVETGKISPEWVVMRLEATVSFIKTCVVSCADIDPICKIFGSINDVAIGEFFSDFNIIVQNTEGTAVGEWDGTKWIVPTSGGLCLPATVENSDESFQVEIPSGDTEVLEDYEFEFQDEDGNILNTETRPAMIGETFIVGAGGACPTEFSYDLYVNGEFYETIIVNINEDINITT